jgi:hypothetical protein
MIRSHCHFLRAGKAIALAVCLSELLTETAWSGLHFRGSPGDKSGPFLIVEDGIAGTLAKAGSGGGSSSHTYVHNELGVMKNVNARYALGVTHYLVFKADGEDVRAALRVRERRWLSRRFSMNLSLGTYYWGGGTDLPALTGQIDINCADLISLYSGIETYRSNGAGADWTFGIKASSYPGTVVMGAGALALGLVVIAFMSGGYD